MFNVSVYVGRQALLGPVEVSSERLRRESAVCPARRESPHRGVPRSRLATPQGAICGPTLRDKRCFTAIQRSSPLAQNDCAAWATPRLAAHSHNMERLARARIKRQQALDSGPSGALPVRRAEIIGKMVRAFSCQAITAPATVDETRFVGNATAPRAWEGTNRIGNDRS